MEKRVKLYAIVCSILYLALFFPSFYIGMLVPHLYDNPNIGTFSGLSVVVLSIIAPITIIIGIGIIWYQYFGGSERGVYFGCLFPLACALIIYILMLLIRLVA